jgi:hypothetical protein
VTRVRSFDDSEEDSDGDDGDDEDDDSSSSDHGENSAERERRWRAALDLSTNIRCTLEAAASEEEEEVEWEEESQGSVPEREVDSLVGLGVGLAALRASPARVHEAALVLGQSSAGVPLCASVRRDGGWRRPDICV